jgi:acetyl-CoA C-acetyltransferase
MNSKVAAIASATTQLRTAWSGAQHIDLISAVVAQVFKGTGLTLNDVDFVLDSGSDVLDGRSISNCGFLGALGAHHKEESRIEEDGLWAALYGVTKIAAGAAQVGLIVAYSKPSESDVSVYYASQCEPFYQRPVGFEQCAASGLQAQRYLCDHGVTRQDLARLTAHRWHVASRFDHVQMAAVPNEAAVLESVNAAAPLTTLMMARPVDGAVAILLVSEEVARRATPRPIWVTGLGASMDRHSFAARKAGALEACDTAAKRAYSMAGWKRAPTSVLAEVSASSAVGELMVLESLGLAAVGKAIGLIDDSKTLVNLSGGSLPADPIMATGLIRLSEAMRQLSHPADYGIKAPASAIVHATGGVGMQTHCVVTLEV